MRSYPSPRSPFQEALAECRLVRVGASGQRRSSGAEEEQAASARRGGTAGGGGGGGGGGGSRDGDEAEAVIQRSSLDHRDSRTSSDRLADPRAYQANLDVRDLDAVVARASRHLDSSASAAAERPRRSSKTGLEAKARSTTPRRSSGNRLSFEEQAEPRTRRSDDQTLSKVVKALATTRSDGLKEAVLAIWDEIPKLVSDEVQLRLSSFEEALGVSREDVLQRLAQSERRRDEQLEMVRLANEELIDEQINKRFQGVEALEAHLLELRHRFDELSKGLEEQQLISEKLVDLQQRLASKNDLRRLEEALAREKSAADAESASAMCIINALSHSRPQRAATASFGLGAEDRDFVGLKGSSSDGAALNASRPNASFFKGAGEGGSPSGTFHRSLESTTALSGDGGPTAVGRWSQAWTLLLERLDSSDRALQEVRTHILQGRSTEDCFNQLDDLRVRTSDLRLALEAKASKKLVEELQQALLCAYR